MKTREIKIRLEDYGSFLGIEKGCLIVRDSKRNTKAYPYSENRIAEVRIKSGNVITSGALASLGFWSIDTVILSRHGRPVAMLKSFTDDSHVETRICQYEALKDDRWFYIAKQFLLAKIRGENMLLRKYGLRSLDSYRISQAIKRLDGKEPRVLRNKLMSYEGKCSAQYFNQVFTLFAESIRPDKRKGHKAYDGVNNLLNLAYNAAHWKVELALAKARLEPYLGFLHVVQFGLPSLTYDFLELYRYLLDDFAIEYARTSKLSEKDFVLATDDYAGRKAKRKFLKYRKATEFTDRLNGYFESMVEIPRIKRGRRQELETLINEEALLLAKFLRHERKEWKPRIPTLFA